MPSLYGELDENYWRERGYILSDTDTDLSPELSPHDAEGGENTEDDKNRNSDSDDISELTRESWEVSLFLKFYSNLYFVNIFSCNFIYLRDRKNFIFISRYVLEENPFFSLILSFFF